MSSTSKPPYGHRGGKPIEDVPLLSGGQPKEDVPVQSGGDDTPGYTFTFVPHNPFAGPRPTGLRPPGAFLSAPPESVPVHKPRPVDPGQFAEGDTTLWDYLLLGAMSLDESYQLGGRAMQWLGLEDVGQAVEEFYARNEEQSASGLSPAMRREMAKDFIVKDEDALFGYRPGPGATSAPKILGTIVQSAPQLLAGGGVSKALKGMLIARGLGPRLAALIGGALGEGTMDGALAKKKTEDTIMNADIGYLSLTPEYRDEYARLGNLPEVERQQAARRAVATKASNRVGLLTGGISALTGGATNSATSQLAAGTAGRSAGGKALGYGLETLPQLPKGASGQYMLNQAERQYADPDKDIFDGVGEAAAEGILGAMTWGRASFESGGAGRSRAQAGKKSPAQPQAVQVRPGQAEAQTLPAKPAPFETSASLTPQAKYKDFAGTRIVPAPTHEQMLSALRRDVRSDVDALFRQNPGLAPAEQGGRLGQPAPSPSVRQPAGYRLTQVEHDPFAE